MKIAIIGSSLSGIIAAEILSDKEVTLFEQGNSKLNVDKNKFLLNSKIIGNKTKTLNEGIGGTSQLWTGGLVRKYPHLNQEIPLKFFSKLSKIFNVDKDYLLNDIRHDGDFILQKTIVLDKPLKGEKYLNNLLNKSKIRFCENSKVISINCNNKKIHIIYKKNNSSEYFSEAYDYCFLSNGTLGFHELLPKIFFNEKSLTNKNYCFKVATHPKTKIGYAKSSRWEKWNKFFSKIDIESNFYSYERIIFNLKEDEYERIISLRIFSRRIRYMIKISKIFKFIDDRLNLNNYLKITNFLDNQICKLANILKLKERFSCEIFFSDEFKGESVILQKDSNLYLKCSFNKIYIKKIYDLLIKKLTLIEKRFKVRFFIENYLDWKITTLHSHLCSSLHEECEIKEKLIENNIIPISCTDLPIGYFNPMIESLLQTLEKTENIS